MRCAAYCTATVYDISVLFEHLKTSGVELQLYRDIIYTRSSEGVGDIFYFPQGCLICWGLTHQQEKLLLQDLKKYEKEPLTEIKQEVFNYKISDKTAVDKINDILTIEGEDASIKLAISYGLAQSVKLDSYEDTVAKSIAETNYIPRELAKKGKIPLSRRQLSRKMGRLFVTRSSINLNSDFLDTPDLFWENPKLESYYKIAANYLDITIRIEVLNRRLDVIYELFDMLKAEQQHKHSTVLEIIIILLISLETFLFAAKEIFAWF